MELLTAVFSRLLSMALMALPVMAVVVLVRLAMARLRVPRKYSCALWFAVGLRLRPQRRPYRRAPPWRVRLR